MQFFISFTKDQVLAGALAGEKISNQHKEARNFLNINFIAQLFLHKTRYKNNNFLACTLDESKTKKIMLSIFKC